MYSYCDICWVGFPSETHRESHFNSKEHLLNQNAFFNRDEENKNFCEVCIVQSNSEDQMTKHLLSRNHMRKLFDKNYILEFKVKRNLEENKMHKSSTFCGNLSNIPVKQSLPHSPSFVAVKKSLTENCEICYISYTSRQHKEQHLEGQVHKKRMEVNEMIKNSKPEDIKNCCDICYLIIPDKRQFLDHLNSDKHKKTSEIKNKFFNHDDYKSITIEAPLSKSPSNSSLELDTDLLNTTQNKNIEIDEKEKELINLCQNLGNIECLEFRVEDKDLYSNVNISQDMNTKWNSLNDKMEQIKNNFNKLKEQEWYNMISLIRLKD
jgi:hypothetical protein